MNSRVEISKRLVLVNTASAAAARIINVSVFVWLHAYLLRRISSEEYALLHLLTQIIILLPLFTSILTAGLGRYVLDAHAKGDDRGVTQIVSTMFPLLAGAALVILAGGLTLAWHIDKVLLVPSDRLWDARIMMALLVVSTAVKPPCAAFNVGFYVRQKYVLLNVIGVCHEMLRVSLLFVLLFAVSTRVLWVVVSSVTAELAMMVVVLLLSRRMVPALRFRVQEIQWARAWELMFFGGWSFIGTVTVRLRETVVLLILNWVAPTEVAVYSVGSLGRRQIDLWTDVMAGPLYPVVTGMHALGAKQRIRNIYLRGGRLALWITLLAALPAMIYAWPIVHLYTGVEEYMEAAVVMVLSLADLPLASGVWMIWQVANATARVRATGVYILVTQPLIVLLTLYAVGVLGWGAWGVALAAFAVGITTSIPLLWPLGLKLADVRFHTWIRETLLPGLLPGCLAAVVWAALNVLVGPDTWLEVGLCTMAGMLCYLLALLIWCLEPGDRKDLAEVMTRLRNFTRSFFGGPPDHSSRLVACTADHVD